MQEVWRKEYPIPASFADHTARLGVHNAFGLFMDAATEHAEALGVGYRAMAKRGLFWLTVKTRIDFIERPHIGETVLLTTWPERPGKLRSCRSYEMRMAEDGRMLLRGKTEWAVVNMKTGMLVPMEGVFPAEIGFSDDSAIPEPFTRITAGWEDAETYSEYRIRSTDIDIGGHMNNAAYVRAMLGGFSVAELDSMAIRSAEVNFKRPCFEGETLRFQRKAADGALDIRVSRSGGDETVLLARLR